MSRKIDQKTIKKKFKLGWSAICKYLLDYSQDTTIHGLKYIGSTDRPIIERVFWIFALVASTIGCTALIYEMFEKLRTNPITVSLAERPSLVQDIPFPAITICSETQTTFVDSNSEFNFQNILNEGENFDFTLMNELNKARLQAIAFICKPEYLKKFKLSADTNDLIKVMRTLVDENWFLKQSAIWNQNYKAPFAIRLTPYGFCFTFNIINASDLLTENASPDFYYTRNILLHEIDAKNVASKPNLSHDFPWKATRSDQDSGLSLSFRRNNQSLKTCSRYEGFRYFVHGSNELLSSKNHFQLQFGELTELLIKPKMTITEEDLKTYLLERRNCYFDDERKLKFFKQYSKNNCEQECLSNFTQKMCGCVSFSVIRDAKTPICNAEQMNCFNKAENELFNGELVTDGNYEKDKFRILNKCKCYSQCTSLRYDLEFVKTNYKTHLSEDKKIASLKVFFKNTEFLPLKRFQLYGTVDFLANCGGLLGLFVGVSVLSIVEVFYYFILRLACILRNSADLEDEKEDKSSQISIIEDGHLHQNGTMRRNFNKQVRFERSKRGFKNRF